MVTEAIKLNGNDDPVCKTGKKTQMCIMDFWTQREGEGGMIWENDILTCILSCKKKKKKDTCSLEEKL